MDESEHRIDRRRALGLGAKVAAGAWVAPVILTIDRAAAQGSAGFFITGFVTNCLNELGPGETFDLVAEETTTSLQYFATTDDPGGTFTLGPLPAGTYNITFTPTGGGFPDDQVTDVIVSGPPLQLILDYDANGC
jgi:hypothetical protein